GNEPRGPVVAARGPGAEATAGEDTSSASVPEAGTSSHATPPVSDPDAVMPSVCDPDDGASCLNVQYRAPLELSRMSSTTVVPEPVSEVVPWIAAPYTKLEVAVIVPATVNAVVAGRAAFGAAPACGPETLAPGTTNTRSANPGPGGPPRGAEAGD